jgi:hypothetical protein
MQNINFIGSSQEDTRISNYFKQMEILKAENAKLLQENKAMKTLVFNQREEIKAENLSLLQSLIFLLLMIIEVRSNSKSFI